MTNWNEENTYNTRPEKKLEFPLRKTILEKLTIIERK